ncbi:MAG: hypothetical protein EZS28_040809, partial [Streblomastix strix]
NIPKGMPDELKQNYLFYNQGLAQDNPQMLGGVYQFPDQIRVTQLETENSWLRGQITAIERMKDEENTRLEREVDRLREEVLAVKEQNFMLLQQHYSANKDGNIIDQLDKGNEKNPMIEREIIKLKQIILFNEK